MAGKKFSDFIAVTVINTDHAFPLLENGVPDKNKIFTFDDFVAQFFGNELLGFETGITAFAGGGQAGAYALTKKYNDIAVVASVSDSVKLPDGLNGRSIHIRNSGANTMDVFPNTGQKFSTLAINAAKAVPSGSALIAHAIKLGVWSFDIIT